MKQKMKVRKDLSDKEITDITVSTVIFHYLHAAESLPSLFSSSVRPKINQNFEVLVTVVVIICLNVGEQQRECHSITSYGVRS